MSEQNSSTHIQKQDKDEKSSVEERIVVLKDEDKVSEEENV